MKWSVLVLCFAVRLGETTFPSISNILPDIPVLSNISEALPDISTLSNISDAFQEIPLISNISEALPDIPETLPDIPRIPNPLNVLFQNKCYEDLGCFYTGPPFYHPLHRPLSLPPTSYLKTKFFLFTPFNPTEEYELEPNLESLDNSTFNSSLDTKFLIHGYRSDLDINDIRFDMRDALLNNGPCNVIVVDWTENNGPPYPQAVANARPTGAIVARMIHFLMNYTGIRPESIHVIGHSLGGQMAGWVGERVPNLGRITGLDPAGPYFQDADKEVRLDSSDAKFVDVIHSDGGEIILTGLGISQAIGHMDFYPNGGRRQPGCIYASESETAVGAVVNFTTKWLLSGCDHERANILFLDSIDNSDCRFLAVHCTSYSDFEKGLCPPTNSTMSEMGFHAKKIEGLLENSKFFLRTNSSAEYCLEDSIYL